MDFGFCIYSEMAFIEHEFDGKNTTQITMTYCENS